jgi:hypothetical protein
MPASLPFARFVQLIKAIDELPMPKELFNRHRMQYDYILGQLTIGRSKGRDVTVADLSNCPILGSQPTANKRLQELISYGLIFSKEGQDRRQKVLMVTEAGHKYMLACSDAMEQAMRQSSS